MGNEHDGLAAWNDPPSDDIGPHNYDPSGRYVGDIFDKRAEAAEQGAIRSSAPVSVEDSQFPDDNWPGTETRSEEGEGRHKGVQVGDSVRERTVQERSNDFPVRLDDQSAGAPGMPDVRGEASPDGVVWVAFGERPVRGRAEADGMHMPESAHVGCAVCHALGFCED